MPALSAAQRGRQITREALQHAPKPSPPESVPTSDYSQVQRGLEHRQDVRDAQIVRLTGQVEELQKTVRWMLTILGQRKSEAA